MGNECTVARRLTIGAGTMGDYRALERFHYRGGPLVGVTRVFAARYAGDDGVPELAGIVVEALPPLACVLRSLSLPGRFGGMERGLGAVRMNREMRTIVRVVVHPVFRGTGLAVRLVRHILATAETPYVEALAAMGRVHPFFSRAGMRKFDRPPLDDAVRLTAALKREGLDPLDLVDVRGGRVTEFLAGELRRFSRRKDGTIEEWLAEARRRLLSQPVYYLWARG